MKLTLKVGFGVITCVALVVLVPMVLVNTGLKWFTDGSLDGITQLQNSIRSM